MTALIAAGVLLVLVTAAVSVFGLSVARVAYLATATLVLIISWNGIRFAGGSFANGFFVLAAVATFAYVIVDRVPVPLPPWLLGCGAILLCAALVTAVWPANPSLLNQSTLQYAQIYSLGDIPLSTTLIARSNVSALLTWEIALIILPVTIAVVARTPRQINQLLDLWAAGAVINALVGVLDLAGFHSLAAVPEIGNRSAGLTVHPNYLALTCLFGLPVTARMIRTSPRRTAFGIIGVAILLGGEYASGSRDGAAVAILVVLLCLIGLPRVRFLLQYVIPLAAVALGVALAVPSVGHAITTQIRFSGSGSGDVSINGSDYQRQIFAHVAERQFRARPLSGVGIYADNDAQNIYLQILAAAGVLGMAAFAVLAGGLLDSVRRVLRSRVSTEGIAIGIAVVAWLVNGYFDSQLADKYLYVLPGILIACVRVAQAERATTELSVAPATEQPPSMLPAGVPAVGP